MIKIDYHVHTNFSDGKASAAEVLDRAKEAGLDCVAITDHFDKYDGKLEKYELTEEKLARHFSHIRAYAGKIGVRVLCGIETCTDFQGNLCLEDRVFDMCDLIITSPHYIEYDGELTPGDYYNSRYWNRYKEKVLNMARGPGDILGHCEGFLPLDGLLVPGGTTYEQRKDICRRIAERFFDQEYILELSSALKKSGKVLELHCATQTPREAVVETLAKAGTVFSIGSDAHVPEVVGNTGWGAKMLEKYHGKLLCK